MTLANAQGTTVGGSAAGDGNNILTNQGFGVYASGLCNGTLVQANTIAANSQGNVNLTNAKGVTYIP